MPSDSPHNAIRRQWELLKLLPSSAPGKSASDLAIALPDRFKVTKRTVERDLAALEELFLITHSESTPFGWYRSTSSAFGLQALSDTEALSLNLLQRFLRPILPAAMTQELEPLFKHAERKLGKRLVAAS